MLDTLLDVTLDTLKILPFLFLTYLAMEYLEEKMGHKASAILAAADSKGPFFGAVLGVVPQCGFSATASGFFAGGLITAGTLIAVYLSTSDEMLPVLLSSGMAVTKILKILSWKVVIAVISGMMIDRFYGRRRRTEKERIRIHDLCTEDNCQCGQKNGRILVPALRHTGKTILFIFIISLIAAILIDLTGEDAIAAFLGGKRFLGVLLSALFGLIPNCAASVMITSLYIQGILDGAQMMAGLLVGAGVGLLVLFRSNHHLRENFEILGLLYASGAVWGILLEVLRISF